MYVFFREFIWLSNSTRQQQQMRLRHSINCILLHKNNLVIVKHSSLYVWSTLTVFLVDQWSYYCVHTAVNSWQRSNSNRPIRRLQHNNPPPVGRLPETAQRALRHHSSAGHPIGREELNKLGTHPMSLGAAVDGNF